MTEHRDEENERQAARRCVCSVLWSWVLGGRRGGVSRARALVYRAAASLAAVHQELAVFVLGAQSLATSTSCIAASGEFPAASLTHRIMSFGLVLVPGCWLMFY